MTVNRLQLLSARLASFLRRNRGNWNARRHARPFSGQTSRRVLILGLPERIPQSQLHPFHYYAEQIRSHHDAEIREITPERYLAGDMPGLDGATSVCFQTNFDVPQSELAAMVAVLHRRNPGARLVYLDWFAPTDLRLAERMNSLVDLYVKKHVLRDRSQYGQATLGDTNLTDYYSRRFNLNMPETRFPIPPGFLDKLLIGPSFATADFMIDTFAGSSPLTAPDRPFDIHARVAVQGTDWYQAMRGESLQALQALSGLNVLTETGVGLVQYLHELQSSKLCFSPFGYGEVCWRDYEAIANGAVLLKPDMSHIETRPDIFVPGETYMPVKWDLSDFAETVDLLLSDDALRRRLTSQAFAVLHDYVAQARFVDQMARVFA